LEKCHGLLAKPSIQQHVKAKELVRSLLDVAAQLDSWHEAAHNNANDRLFWAVPARLHNPSDDKYGGQLFPFAIEFASIDVAMPLVLRNSVLTQVLRMVLTLDATCGYLNSSVLSKEMEGLSERYNSKEAVTRTADKAARFVCQTMEYFHRIDMGTLGPQATCHGQWSIKNHFKWTGQERELDWCLNIKNMTGPGTRCEIGFKMMRFGDDYQ